MRRTLVWMLVVFVSFSATAARKRGGNKQGKDLDAYVQVIPGVNEMNLGDLDPMTVTNFSYTISNRTDQVIEIRHAYSLCPCTKVTIPERKIQPHSAAQIHLRLDTAKISGDDFVRSCFVQFKDLRSRLYLKFKGRVKTAIIGKPAGDVLLRAAEVPAVWTNRYEMTLTLPDVKLLPLVETNGTLDVLTMLDTQTLSNGWKKVTLTVRSTKRTAGKGTASVMLQVQGYPPAAGIKLGISARAGKFLTAHPKSFELGKEEQTEIVRNANIIAGEEELDPAKFSVSPQIEGLKSEVRLQQSRRGENRYRIHFELSREAVEKLHQRSPDGIRVSYPGYIPTNVEFVFAGKEAVAGD